MSISTLWKTGLWIAALSVYALAQAPKDATPAQTPKDAAPVTETKGLPPRTSPTEYLAHGKAGSLTIAGEFAGHNVPTPQGPLTTEDYIVVELGIFGAADAKVKLAAEDFSLKINGKKALSTQPYGLVIGNVKDPEWAPPEPPAQKKSALSTGGGGGGGGGQDDSTPKVVHVPIEVQRALNQRVQKATLPEGTRALPVAGLIYFQYRGKEKGIKSLELVYSGPAGKGTIELHP
jgi:hypothetical protein